VGPAYLDPAPEPLPVLGQPAAVATVNCAVALVAAGVAAEGLFPWFELARLLPA
jgi:hypothetical protein